MRYATGALLLVAVGVQRFTKRPVEGNVCHADPAACHFSTSYEASRALFISRAADVAAACGATRIEALPETAPGVRTDAVVVDGCRGEAPLELGALIILRLQLQSQPVDLLQ